MTLSNSPPRVRGQEWSSSLAAVVQRTEDSWEAAWTALCGRVNVALAEATAGVALPVPDRIPQASLGQLFATLELDAEELRRVARAQLGIILRLKFPELVVGFQPLRELSPGAVEQWLIAFRQKKQPEAPQWWQSAIVDPMLQHAEAVRVDFAKLHEMAIRLPEGPGEPAPVAPVAQVAGNANEQQAETEGSQAAMRCDGDSWVIRWGEEYGIFPAKDYRALDLVAKLVAGPNRPMELNDLVDADTRTVLKRPEARADVLNNPAVAGLRKRYKELQQDRAQLQRGLVAGSDAGPESELRCREIDEELASLAAEVKKAIGPGNRKRKLGRTRADRAWDALTKSLRRLWPRLRAAGMPKLATHLETGIDIDQPSLAYRPPPDTPAWHVEVDPT
jgi:hypothetical protein